MTTHPEQPVHDLAIRLDEENRRLREALAAARRECEGLREAVALHLKCPEEAAVSCLTEIRDDFSVIEATKR